MEEIMEICLKPFSPCCLASGGADVNLDTDIIHDKWGVPYFPARRLRGLLYESALEVVEMMESSKLDSVKREDVEELFGHGNSSVQLIIHDLYLPQYEEMTKEWEYIQTEYNTLIRPADVLEAYTSLRSQTAIGENGIAKDHSLRTIRVLDTNEEVYFVGSICIKNGTSKHKNAFILAMQNLSYVGLNRSRGFGEVRCSLLDYNHQQDLVKDILGVNK